MTERLLQFIWQFQYFNNSGLVTTAGEELAIVHPGQYNNHQGPDFLEARMHIDNRFWTGSVELHINASDWHRHAHSQDRNYENVILHVVWNNDENPVPAVATLLMEDRVSNLLLHQYEAWMNSTAFIPCDKYLAGVDPLIWTAWRERLLIERMQRRSVQIKTLLAENNYDWEETFWFLLARSLGLHVNADAFEELARSVSFRLLLRHRNQLHQLEAILLGQAGLLEAPYKDKYMLMLQKEYGFYQLKYGLKKIDLPVHFLRMRPAAFPTVRLAQLAMLIHNCSGLFAEVLREANSGSIKAMMSVTANDYWHYHFTFSSTGTYQPKALGVQMVNNILVNAVVPVLFAYGDYHQEEKYKQKALDWIDLLPAEKNSVTMDFARSGIRYRSASASQALLELKQQYCDRRRCLDCSIGNSILKRQQ